RALPDQGVDELHRDARHPEPADEDGRAVRDVADRLVVRRTDHGHATFSSTTASAWPTPMQIAATPHRSPDSTSRCASVPRIRPPDAPSGCPIAMAPPLAFTISGSTPQAST